MKKQITIYGSILLSMFFIINECQAVQVYDYDTTSWQTLEQHIDPNATAYAFQRSDTIKRAGCYSGRFELRPGDIAKGGERCEFNEANYILPEHSTAFYGFSVLIPASELTDCGSDCAKWRNIMQWHMYPKNQVWDHHPLLRLSLDNGKISFILTTSGNAPVWEKVKIVNQIDFNPNQWIDFVVQLSWAGEASGGVINIWRDGQQIAGPIINVGRDYYSQYFLGVFWKHGIYREPVADTDIVYFDELRRGVSYGEVAPQCKDCDSEDSIALFDPDASEFYLKNSLTGGSADIKFYFGPSNAGYKPITGDWNSNGQTTIGLYNPDQSKFYLKNSHSGGAADIKFCFGPAFMNWVPISGDWNGNGQCGIGLYDPATGTFRLKNANNSGTADEKFRFGPSNAGWQSISGDWNGDGVDTIGLYSPQNGTFYLKNTFSGGSADVKVGFGPRGTNWKPVCGDWDGDGIDEIGLYNPTKSTFYLKNTLSGGTADIKFGFGPGGSGWLPLAGGERNPICTTGIYSGEVQKPVFVMNLKGQTGWFASPLVYDLDSNGSNELIAAYYDIFIFNSNGELIAKGEEGNGRVYAPHVVADLEGDGITEIVVGRGSQVIAYEWKNSSLVLKAGWPASTSGGGNNPEIRGMAAADLDGNGTIEIAVTTTQTVDEEDGGSQVYVFSHNGSLYQPAGGHTPAWPRYNALTGYGNDADRNGYGHHGFGSYGLNIGIGNIDDDPELEIIATYDNHHIQAFNHDGVAIDTSPYFTNRSNEFSGERLTWGQFIRWADPVVEKNHYNFHTGDWPHPSWTEWLQWTASPPNVVDLDGDGKNEVVGIPNIEKNIPYETQAYGIMVLEGNYSDGSRSGMRKAGWETLPRGNTPISVDGWYPPKGVPAPTTINISGDEKPEVIISLNDGSIYAFDSSATKIWNFDYRHNKQIMFASEATVADLNQDGSPEIIFTTYGDPDVHDSGFLIILGANGLLLWDVPLPDPGHNGNGNGAPSAPTVGDLDGDGQLEIFVQTFDHSMDIFTVPDSSTNCIKWPTARGGNLRMGKTNSTFQ